MKTLLATSAVTYVPDNYYSLFAELMEEAGEHVAGLVVLEARWVDLLKTAAGLYWLGAHKVARTMARNIVELPLQRREALFVRRGLPVLRAKSMNDPQIIAWVERQRIDLVANLRTRCIYRKKLLSAPRLGCINIHHGLLPQYRGTLCDLYALADRRPAGFTIHAMSERVDAGRILVSREVSSGCERDYVEYLERTGRCEGRALADLLQRTAREGVLPTGCRNQCSRPVYTRTPDRGQIRELCAAGMVL